MASAVLYLLIGLLVGYWAGYRAAHIIVAEECRQLGGFHVGGSVFRCTEIKRSKDGQAQPE